MQSVTEIQKMCAWDKGKTFPLNTQKLEPGQERDGILPQTDNINSSSAFKRRFKIDLVYCIREAKKHPKYNRYLHQNFPNFPSVGQQCTNSGSFLWHASFSCFTLMFFLAHTYVTPSRMCPTMYIYISQHHIYWHAKSWGLVSRTSHLALS